ncbi:tetratricopeptide repeat (TPR)-/U-box domain-containing protein [Thecamonas trahens ATCC 50062]|uniref:RING-type E3 ubiquitin transferase n=1 Tax=Thecamonas trahens ATCC 50062 TaxID=461836 RepID=A0A0L0D8H9_THETB|nr:tetratricopeptide repeat (TPR)-/U-box domain-containing protein [Thecamonas trahens ATCC 50062]KNC48545.1 tetratricopeptide repeat (TPR)-/U-box domain-containing protein [Thecamonas trahens ATCC 50062]|eukprot:XP_013758652.1 tetratricopeptide repeat (TPR)-/U-box domain-containing protein [Thecamonas trahens ATCC 50062]
MASLDDMNAIAGNAYRAGNLEEAIRLYTHAIEAYPEEIKLYTNRALCNLKTGRMGKCVDDCETAISLAPDAPTLKSVYLKGKAIALGGWSVRDGPSSVSRESIDSGLAVDISKADALPLLRHAMKMAFSLSSGASQWVSQISELGISLRIELWREQEEARRAEAQPLTGHARRLFQADMREQVSNVESLRNAGALDDAEAEAQVAEIRRVYSNKMSDIAVALTGGELTMQPVDIPEALCCPISFELMVDPVVLPSGVTYARASIDELLALGGSQDPMTREPISAASITPNLRSVTLSTGLSIPSRGRASSAAETSRSVYVCGW